MEQYKNLLNNIERFVKLTKDEKEKLIAIIKVKRIKKKTIPRPTWLRQPI